MWPLGILEWTLPLALIYANYAARFGRAILRSIFLLATENFTRSVLDYLDSTSRVRMVGIQVLRQVVPHMLTQLLKRNGYMEPNSPRRSLHDGEASGITGDY